MRPLPVVIGGVTLIIAALAIPNGWYNPWLAWTCAILAWGITEEVTG